MLIVIVNHVFILMFRILNFEFQNDNHDESSPLCQMFDFDPKLREKLRDINDFDLTFTVNEKKNLSRCY